MTKPEDSIKEKILFAYEKMALAYNELIDVKPHNAFYDRPNTLALLPDVLGKHILDAGCGPGKYAQILSESGALITGFDMSPTMIRLAIERNQGKGNFFVHDLSKPLDMLHDQQFDMVLCALALHYIEDWTMTIREFGRVLKPGGLLILSTEHPFFEYNFFRSKHYFSVEKVQCTWRGFGRPVDVVSYRRPLSNALSALTENGFYIDRFVEPLPTPEFEIADPKHFRELNSFPAFMCIRAVKRG